MTFPSQVPLTKLNQRHPHYARFSTAWEQIRLLYEGGTVLKEAVTNGQFLIRAPKELPEVYTVRQNRFSYSNLLSNVIGWYDSALYKQAPEVLKRVQSKAAKKAKPPKPAAPGQPPPSSAPSPVFDIPQDAQDFCAVFEKDCDKGKTSFNQFFKSVTETALLYRRAYILIDLPQPGDDEPPPASLGQQRAAGALNPYLVLYRPANVINWETDQYGNLEWAEIYIQVQEQEFLEEPKTTDYWYYFDRTQVALYRHDIIKGKSTTAGEEVADLEQGYPRPHAMTDQGRVPIQRIELPDGLWLANRILLLLVNHLNQDNAFDFSLFQSNIPQLVIENGANGDYKEPEQPTISAVGYHSLPNGGKMFYLEPAGNAYKATEDRLASLEERIYKACYLMAQARNNKSTPTAQSGVSKQMDQAPGRDALSGIGDVIRPAQQDVYRDVLRIAGYEDIEPDVQGYDFSDRATTEDMALLEQSSIIQVQSTTFERELQKKNVTLTFPDMNPETRDTIYAEIDAAPTPSEEAAQQAEEQKALMMSGFQKSLKSTVAPSEL